MMIPSIPYPKSPQPPGQRNIATNRHLNQTTLTAMAIRGWPTEKARILFRSEPLLEPAHRLSCVLTVMAMKTDLAVFAKESKAPFEVNGGASIVCAVSVKETE